MFKKILIANRGEIALRIIRTCREMGIKTVAVYSKADEESLHVRFADEAVCIGPAPSSESYLKIPNIIAAAEITNADAIHPGYGFLSENAKFSKICSEHGIKFIGASAEQIDRMGDKATAKQTMKEAGVPTIPGSDGLLKDLADAKKTAKAMGYPVMIKATAGGGGKGMRAIWSEDEMETHFNSAVQEATAAFGNGGMYMEKLILEPRHIEIQVVGSPSGWRNEFERWGNGSGVKCGLSVLCDGEWITKYDGADETNIEPTKGGFSDSMKRAAVQWGLGRDLYDYPRVMIEGEHKYIPDWAHDMLNKLVEAFIGNKLGDRKVIILKEK